MKIPLSIICEDARQRMTAAYSKIAQETHLPAYLMEGILTGILSEVRAQKNLELAADYAALGKNEDKEEETDG